MKNLAALNQRREKLKQDISELEDTFKFKNPKESLSTFTKGFTDQFITDKVDIEGHHSLGLKTANILSFVTGGISEQFLKTQTDEKGQEKISIKTQNLITNFTESAMKIGVAAFVAKYAKKSLKHKKWKRKIIGLALIYLGPFLLKFVREKLDEFQDKEVLESLNKII